MDHKKVANSKPLCIFAGLMLCWLSLGLEAVAQTAPESDADSSATDLSPIVLKKPQRLAQQSSGQSSGPTTSLLPLPEIDTDRPDITDSPLSVPPGFLTIESESFFERLRRQRGWSIPNSVCRLGLFNRNELRVSVPSYVAQRARGGFNGEVEFVGPEIEDPTIGDTVNVTPSFGMDPATRAHGVSDLAVGWKYQIGPIGKLDIAAIPELGIPTGSPVFRSRTVDPSIRFPYTIPISKNWVVGGMQGLFLTSDDTGRRILIYQPVVLLERELPHGDVFIEFAGDYLHRGRSVQFMHFGGVFSKWRNQQLEAHCGVGMTKASPSIFFAVGYSRMWGPIWNKSRYER